MRGIDGEAEHLVVHFDPQEAELLAQLVEQVVELLTDELPTTPTPAVSGDGAADPFQAWEAEFGDEGADDGTLELLDGELEVDPVVQRLFPDAYRDDAAASHDFRRFTRSEAVARKLEAAQLVLDGLAGADRRGRCFIPREDTGAWLKMLTTVRLALAVRLGIVDEITADEAASFPEEDPRSWLFEVYSWTGWLQESLIEAL